MWRKWLLTRNVVVVGRHQPPLPEGSPLCFVLSDGLFPVGFDVTDLVGAAPSIPGHLWGRGGALQAALGACLKQGEVCGGSA